MAERIYGTPGTLYQRCGGVFGVSGFVDRLMDRWMADDTLNANEMVARWHESAQRPGFKFLVVQIVCCLTGGPQQYTGRDMAESHKHLGISEEEWGVFMEIFNDVCQEFGLPASDVDDLNALMISMEYDIVIQPGERPRADPGPWRPSGHTAYARAGGVYPIALFVDRLVDALVNDNRIPVRSAPLPPIFSPLTSALLHDVCSANPLTLASSSPQISTDGSKRTPAALKYLVTECVCKVAGGYEAITAKDSDETKLLVPDAAWPIVTLTAQLAADHIPEGQPRNGLLKVFDKNKALFTDPHSDWTPPNGGAGMAMRAAAVKSLADSAAGNMVSKVKSQQDSPCLTWSRIMPVRMSFSAHPSSCRPLLVR